jgi:hypothetical protein
MGYAYKVVEVREKMIGGKMSGEKLERLLNDHGAQGWQLRAITSTEIKGRVGPGGVEGFWSPSSARSRARATFRSVVEEARQRRLETTDPLVDKGSRHDGTVGGACLT